VIAAHFRHAWKISKSDY